MKKDLRKEKLKIYLFKKIIATDNDWADFEKNTQITSYKKGEIINKEGDIFNNVYFINSGIIRSFIIDSNGHDFTWHIHYSGGTANIKNFFVTDYASFTKQEPSKLFFEIIKDTELVSISHDFLQKLYNSSENWQKFGRIMAETAYYYTHHRALSLLTETAEIRYKRLLQESPDLIKQVPQYYIASYLGVTPQSLSRIKSNL